MAHHDRLTLKVGREVTGRSSSMCLRSSQSLSLPLAPVSVSVSPLALVVTLGLALALLTT